MANSLQVLQPPALQPKPSPVRCFLNKTWTWLTHAIIHLTGPNAAEADDFTPSRRVRAPPGGKHTDIFSFDAGDDALSTAPPKPTEEVATPEQPADPVAAAAAAPAQSEFEPLTDMKPTRRVRDNPGGKDSIGSLWDEAKPGEFDFKPTRRVRQGPGGQDSISGVSFYLSYHRTSNTHPCIRYSNSWVAQHVLPLGVLRCTIVSVQCDMYSK